MDTINTPTRWMSAVAMTAAVLVACPTAANAEQVDFAREWFRARGVKGPKNLTDCIELVVGTSREQALVCDESHAGPATKKYTHGLVTQRRVVRVVRAAKIVSVLDVETSRADVSWSLPELALELRIADDGMSAVTIDLINCEIESNARKCEKTHEAFVWKSKRFGRVPPPPTKRAP